MTPSNPGVLNVRAKANRVVDHHYDDDKPGKPLYLLIPGGLVAVASLLLIIFIAYRTWLDASLDPNTGLVLILLLAPFYVGGVFVFSYGYELYDIPRALRDTAVIVFITVAAVVILAVLFVVLGSLGDKSGSSSSRSSKSESSTSSGSSGGGVAGGIGGALGGGYGGWGPVFIGSTAPTRVETREVIREVPVEPAKPQPITCPYCSRAYVPAENHYACPGCGSPTSEELRAESEAALNPKP
ncbi:MAG: hypothetical protein M1482_01865 [Chloroflexi bacterium]|nr:hypothetical protein [Chloroflexota bacterium]